MNKFRSEVIGRLGNDAETKYTPNGQMVLELSIAVNDDPKNREKTTWVRVSVWGRQAEALDGLAQNGALQKGHLVSVSGRTQIRTYQGNDGQTKVSVELTADDVTLLTSRSEASGSSQTSNTQYQAPQPSGPPPQAPQAPRLPSPNPSY